MLEKKTIWLTTHFPPNFLDSNLLHIMQDYGVKQAPKRKDISEMKSSLAPQLLELMKMLFNVETYRCILASFFNAVLAHIFLAPFLLLK